MRVSSGHCSSRQTSELCGGGPIRARPQFRLSVSYLACRLSEMGRLFALVVSRSCRSGCGLYWTGSYPGHCRPKRLAIRTSAKADELNLSGRRVSERNGPSNVSSSRWVTVRLWPVADGRHPSPTDRSCFEAAAQARIALPTIERRLPDCQSDLPPVGRRQ